MGDGGAAGLLSGAAVTAEAAARRAREATRIAQLTDDASGRGAVTTYRDRAGREIGDGAAGAARLKAEEADTKRRDKAAEKVRPEWGTGLAQKKAAAEAAAELAAAGSRPFAVRAGGDAAAEAAARARHRWGDPLGGAESGGGGPSGGSGATASRVEREVAAAAARVPGGDAQLLQRSGFSVPREVPAHSWLRRGAPPWPNRYGIQPGRHVRV